MWIFTTVGFFSVVENRHHKGQVCVRARTAVDLDNFRKRYCSRLGPTKKSQGGADYAARAFVGKRAFAHAMERAAKDIDYTNFKSRVMATQGWDRESIYMKIWFILKDAQADGRFDKIGTQPPALSSGPKSGSTSGGRFGGHQLGLGLENGGWESWRTFRNTMQDDDDEEERPAVGGSQRLPEGTHRFCDEEEERDPFFWRDGDSGQAADAADDPEVEQELKDFFARFKD